jgi:hypothetical protein
LSLKPQSRGFFSDFNLYYQTKKLLTILQVTF